MDYNEEQQLVEKEKQLEAARPWWRKAWEWQADAASRHSPAIIVITAIVGLFMAVYTFAHFIMLR